MQPGWRRRRRRTRLVYRPFTELALLDPRRLPSAAMSIGILVVAFFDRRNIAKGLLI